MVEKQRRPNYGYEEKKYPDHPEIYTCENCPKSGKMIVVRSLCTVHLMEFIDKKEAMDKL